MLPMFNVIYIYLTCPFAICKQVVVSEVQSSALFKIASLYFLLNHSSNGGGGPCWEKRVISGMSCTYRVSIVLR